MEFERSIFRVHERVLQGPEAKKWLARLLWFFAILTLYSIANLVLFHSTFVKDRSVLVPAIEEQLKPYFYQEYEKLANVTPQQPWHYESFPNLPLNYSTRTGKFMFDNRGDGFTLQRIVTNATNMTIVS